MNKGIKSVNLGHLYKLVVVSHSDAKLIKSSFAIWAWFRRPYCERGCILGWNLLERNRYEILAPFPTLHDERELDRYVYAM